MEHSKKILLTCFEPFGGNDTNITQAVADEVNLYNVTKVTLPVSFERTPQVFRDFLNVHKPDIIIMLGQCKEGDNIRLERFAHNMMDAQKPDNDGVIPIEEIIYPIAPLAYITPFPLHALSKEMKEQGMNVVVSNSAGLYVCNRLYFEALHLDYPSLFIHIPKGFDVKTAAYAVEEICRRAEGK